MYKLLIFITLLTLLSCGKIKNKAKEAISKSKETIEQLEDAIDKAINPTAEQVFERGTGLKITDTIYDVMMVNTYFPHEGELSVVFKTSGQQLEKWLTENIPWKNNKWERGIVSDSVFQCKFGIGFHTRAEISKETTKITYFYEDEDLQSMIDNKNKYWISKNRCCPSMPYHNGNLLIIEKDKNRVWYSTWDY